MLLAGDVGGTNTRLALFRAAPTDAPPVRRGRFASREHASLEEVVAAFVGDESGRVEAAAFGVAGPVVDGCVHATNLPWVVDERALARRFGWRRVALLNDLETTALGIDGLAEERTLSLAGGAVDRRAVRAVVAPGTGLGMAALLPRGDGVRVLPSEGGHAGFAPRGAREREFLAWLEERFGTATWERAVSGPGLAHLYAFLAERDAERADPALAARVAEDAAAAPRRVGEAALAGTCPLAVEAARGFARLLGAIAQQLALTLLARGGVYLGGGLPPKLRPFLEGAELRRRFHDHPTMAAWLRDVPLRLVLEEDASLLGAAACAAALVTKQ